MDDRERKIDDMLAAHHEDIEQLYNRLAVIEELNRRWRYVAIELLVVLMCIVAIVGVYVVGRC